MKLKKKEIKKNIFLVTFPNQYLITSTLLRFQEYYESPKFHGQYFTLEDFQDWYAKVHNNVFSYYTDWVGFNFPSRILDSFYTGQFEPLSEKEHVFLDLFEPEWAKGLEDYYIISVIGKDQGVIDHEMAHALYSTSSMYKMLTNDIMEKYDTRPVKKLLLESGYARHVIKDEIQAYGVAAEGTKIGNAYAKHLKPMQKELRITFDEFML
jgi:hypothetical protein